jgi:hypothetical protein
MKLFSIRFWYGICIILINDNIWRKRAMKTPIYLLIIVSLILGSCASSYRAGVTEYDDLYYTPRDARMQAEAVNVQTEAGQQNVQAVPQEELSDYEKYRLALEEGYLNEDAQSSDETYALAQEDTMYVGPQEEAAYAYYDDGSSPPVVNNYYGTVNQYSDYTSRIRRFHSPYYGYSYYDPYYSWYDPWYDPYYYSAAWAGALVDGVIPLMVGVIPLMVGVIPIMIGVIPIMDMVHTGRDTIADTGMDIIVVAGTIIPQLITRTVKEDVDTATVSVNPGRVIPDMEPGPWILANRRIAG